MRIANTSGTSTDSLIRVDMRGFSTPTGGTAQSSVIRAFQVPYTDGSTYVDYEFILEDTSNVNSQYWEFRLGFRNTVAVDVGEVTIDSIFLSSIPGVFGVSTYTGDTGNPKVASGLVPESDTVTNSGQFLKADGTWDDPTGGSASNSFETMTVTDTDSGFSWAATGSAVAESATDTLSIVSGVGVNIDVDATSDAIRATIAVNQLPEKTGAVVGTDRLVGTTGTTNWAETFSGIPLSVFSNDLSGITGITAGALIDVSGTTNITIDVDLSEAIDMTAAMVGTDELIVLDAGLQRRKAANEINLSVFNNDIGGGGDVTKVGTPVNNEIAVWTGDGTLEGESELLYTGTELRLLSATPTFAMYESDAAANTHLWKFYVDSALFHFAVYNDAAGANDIFTVGRTTNVPTSINFSVPVYIKEQTSASTDVAAYGQVWVKNNIPNDLYYTNDSGVDYPVGYATYRKSSANVIDNINQTLNMTTDAIADAMVGGAWIKTNTTAYTLTLEPSTDTQFPVGSQIAIYNRGASGIMTVTEGAGTTLYVLTGSASTDAAGSATIAAGGYATLIRESTTVYVLMGAGITP
jgi:hypothetical protein